MEFPMKKLVYITALKCFLAASCLNIPGLLNAQEATLRAPGLQTVESIPSDIYDDSLARLPQVKRSELDVEGQVAFDTYVSPGTGYETGLRLSLIHI